MLNEDKQALLNGTARIRCKLIVKATDTSPEIVLTEQNSVKDWVYNDERYVPQQGFIGQFVARTLEGNLQNISDDFNIENRELELQLGIVRNTTETWYSMGNFIVTDPEDNEVKDNTKFQAMDYTKLFNKRFNGDYTDSVYTASYNESIKLGGVTALWLAKYACAQVGVDFPQTSFTNSDFVITQNPFQAGESCRDVLKEISKLAYSWVRIGQDNKCYIDFNQVDDGSVDIHNVINKDTYYTLETKKTMYGPINNVVVGMSGVDGESHSVKDQASINQYGEHTIYIYDNPLTNTFELRELAQQKANKLFGLNYVHLEVETVGHPWLQGNERINVLDMEDEDNFTYAFNKSLEYNGHIRSIINTMGESEVESTLAYESGFVKNIRNASLNVDKQNGKITALIEDIEESNGIVTERINTLQLDLNGTTSRVATVEKSVTDLEDDIDEKLGLISEDIDGVQINLDEFIDNEYAQGISNLQKQIDGAIQFWNGPEIPTLKNKPAVDWETENDKINHQADIYTVIEDVDGELKQGKSYRFDKVNGDWVWIELTDNELSAVQALAQDALNKAKANENSIVTLKSDVSELKQTDEEITASVDSIENTLVPTADISGSNIMVTDSTNASLVNFQIDGKSTQETRSGVNKFNALAIPTASGIVVNSDGSEMLMPVNTTNNGITDAGKKLKELAPELKVGDTVYLNFDRKPTRDYNTYIYLSGCELLWYTGTSKTITQEMLDSGVCLYANRYSAGETAQITLTDFRMVLGESDVEWEQYGVSPSPDYPSEIKSVGYENLLNATNPNWNNYASESFSNDILTISSTATNTTPFSAYVFDNVKVGDLYTFKSIMLDAKCRMYLQVYSNGTWTTVNGSALDYIDGVTPSKYSYIIPDGVTQIQYLLYSSYTIPTGNSSARYKNTIVTRNNELCGYIPYGKHGIEIKTVGENKFDYNNYTYNNTISSTYRFIQIEDLKPNTTYSFYNYDVNGVSTDSNDYGAIYLTRYPDYNSGVIGAGATMIKNGNNKYSNVTFTTGTNGECYLGVYRANGWDESKWVNMISYFETAMFIEGTTQRPYISYQKHITRFLLNEPLRSLPNGIKDIAYIKHNKLYVNRYIGSKILNGGTYETYGLAGEGDTTNGFSMYSTNAQAILPNIKKDFNKWLIADNFKGIARSGLKTTDINFITSATDYIYVLNIDRKLLETEDVAGFKKWLSEHPTQVDYELETSITEDYGEIDYPITYKNITNISTTDNLEPNMNVTYVREGSMTDYIAGQFTEKDIVQNRQFSELSVKADSISASVTSVEGDLAETNGKVNSLETQITSQEATIKIVETYIDKDTNTLNSNSASEVTTTNGFTFNSEGLNIYVGENSYNTQINNIGTYYRDGDEIIGQTSKDGSILKNLKMQGQTQYAYDGDSYDFTEERVEVDGEYCYATFYNGEE